MESPRSKLRAKLKQKEALRAPKRPPPPQPPQPPVPSVETTTSRLHRFPVWLAEQLVRGFPTVVHNAHPFMLLFCFDMTGDPLTEDASALVGSRLDVLLVKINGGIYYESSTHMDGLRNRIASISNNMLRVTPSQLLYVYDPSHHVKDASVDITSDISKLNYVSKSIPASYVRDGVAWEIPLDPTLHLPSIKTASK